MLCVKLFHAIARFDATAVPKTAVQRLHVGGVRSSSIRANRLARYLLAATSPTCNRHANFDEKREFSTFFFKKLARELQANSRDRPVR